MRIFTVLFMVLISCFALADNGERSDGATMGAKAATKIQENYMQDAISVDIFFVDVVGNGYTAKVTYGFRDNDDTYYNCNRSYTFDADLMIDKTGSETCKPEEN